MRPMSMLLGALAASACGSGDVTAAAGTEASSGADASVGGTESPTTGGLAPDMGAVVAGPKIVWSTPTTTPGSSVYVRSDAPITDVELRVGGLAVPQPPIVSGADGTGALFALPPELGVGVTELAVRAVGAAADSDVAALEVAAPTFVDVAEATGLLQVHDVAGHPESCAWSSTGLAFGDVDGDGDSDFYVGNVGRAGRLMRNDGDGDGDGLPEFVEATVELGLGGVDNVSSAMFIDHDGDGDRDLFIGRRGANVLMRNQKIETGEPGFVDVTAAAGLGLESQRTMGVAWGDYDGDADLDLYVVNHAYCFPLASMELLAQDHLYRNDGGVFMEVTELLGTAPGSPVHSLGFSAVFLDHDRDGDQDLIVINDHIPGLGGPNALWRNDGADGDGWRFTEVGASSGLAIPAATPPEAVNGMGLAVGDVDRDGWPDLAFSNIGPNVLLLNNRDGNFRDVSEAAGVRRGGLPWKQSSITWAAHLFDHDNDTDLDLYFSGGKIHDDALIPDALLRNDAGVFTEVTWAAGVTALASGKGSARVDLDRDGWPDFVTAHWADRLRVYHNRRSAPEHHWLVVDLEGAAPNTEALGSTVAVELADGPTQTCFRATQPALGAGGELDCHFGLGRAGSVAKLTITWPDGTVTTPTPPPVDTRVRYVQ